MEQNKEKWIIYNLKRTDHQNGCQRQAKKSQLLLVEIDQFANRTDSYRPKPQERNKGQSQHNSNSGHRLLETLIISKVRVFNPMKHTVGYSALCETTRVR